MRGTNGRTSLPVSRWTDPPLRPEPGCPELGKHRRLSCQSLPRTAARRSLEEGCEEGWEMKIADAAEQLIAKLARRLGHAGAAAE